MTKAITVSQLNNYVKQVFEAEELLHNIEVVGDIDGLKFAGKQAYFTLKDEESAINCVCFYPERLSGVKNGANVVVRGTVSYWNKAGKISFVVNSCETFGWGALFLKFQQLQEKLRAEGLFDAGVKKALPASVKRLGVVTSLGGAVIHDIESVAHRRNPSVDIVVFGVSVQGEGAANEIARGIEALNSVSVDVIIVARGGGSREDLMAFNAESVARAVFASRVPVVAAVGHESDWTLIDFVADLRAATPSVAAELTVPEILTIRENARRAWEVLRTVMMRHIDGFLSGAQNAWAVLKTTALGKIDERETHVKGLAAVIEANNPLAVLRRGYAKPNKEFAELKTGDELEIMFYNGKAGTEVKWTKNLNA